MLLSRASGATGLACTGLWRTLACRAAAGDLCCVRQLATNNSNGDRPLAADKGVRDAQRQQPSSLAEPPLLHDSMSGADYGYGQRRRGPAGVVRMSSMSEPDYFLQNSMSEGTYDMPLVLQRRGASLNPKRGQGFATAKQLPNMQRIIVANRAAAQEPQGALHDSFSHGEYTPRYK